MLELQFPTITRCSVKNLVTTGIGVNDGFRDAWIEKYSESPLKDALRAYIERGFVDLEIQSRSEVPELPMTSGRRVPAESRTPACDTP